MREREKAGGGTGGVEGESRKRREKDIFDFGVGGAATRNESAIANLLVSRSQMASFDRRKRSTL
jgi:hypothetical protein